MKTDQYTKQLTVFRKLSSVGRISEFKEEAAVIPDVASVDGMKVSKEIRKNGKALSKEINDQRKAINQSLRGLMSSIATEDERVRAEIAAAYAPHDEAIKEAEAEKKRIAAEKKAEKERIARIAQEREDKIRSMALEIGKAASASCSQIKQIFAAMKADKPTEEVFGDRTDEATAEWRNCLTQIKEIHRKQEKLETLEREQAEAKLREQAKEKQPAVLPEQKDRQADEGTQEILGEAKVAGKDGNSDEFGASLSSSSGSTIRALVEHCGISGSAAQRIVSAIEMGKIPGLTTE